ncbi:malonate decarboxylase subunit epsilon [Pendulispora brunnea]|uniref:Malonyl CoA-acyl carrier protein transacylase n=1 Tax=Pendulispora brunnea TaxID=2905690 RepID=A0ABZ2KGL3_9BACT
MTACVAFLFPGQGAQSPGFLHALPPHPAITATLDEACHALNTSLDKLDASDALHSTVGVQLATLVAGVAAARALAAEGALPFAVAGLSIGSYAAAVACGTLAFRDALHLAQLRALYMERAYPRGYGMAAITGLTERHVTRLIQPIDGVYLANINAPTQLVLAGADAGLEAAMASARKAGARTVRRLDIAVPSHCILQQNAAEQLLKAFDGVKLEPPRIPCVGNVGGRALHTADAIRNDLATNLARPVRWHDATRVLYELGARVFVELPPGHALSDLAREAFPDARTLAMENQSPEAIAGVLTQRQGTGV